MKEIGLKGEESLDRNAWHSKAFGEPSYPRKRENVDTKL